MKNIYFLYEYKGEMIKEMKNSKSVVLNALNSISQTILTAMGMAEDNEFGELANDLVMVYNIMREIYIDARKGKYGELHD